MDDDILQQILSEIKDIKENQIYTSKRVDKVDGYFEKIENGLNDIKKISIAIHDHLIKESEDITEISMKLDKVIDNIEFMKHKEFENEQEIFKIKRNLKITKTE